MFLQKLTIASAALVGAGLLAWGGPGAPGPRGGGGRERGAAGGPRPPAVGPRGGAAPPPGGPGRPCPAPDPGRAHRRGRGRPDGGRDPDGKRGAGAEIFIRHNPEFGWCAVEPVSEGQQGRVAVSDADGRFRFELDKASSDWPWGDEPAWHAAQIAAVSPGLAL